MQRTTLVANTSNMPVAAARPPSAPAHPRRILPRHGTQREFDALFPRFFLFLRGSLFVCLPFLIFHGWRSPLIFNVFIFSILPGGFRSFFSFFFPSSSSFLSFSFFR